MDLTIEIVVSGDEAPPAGSLVIVQIRDTTYQDESSVTVAETRVTSGEGNVIARANISCEPGGYPIVWAHVDADSSGDVSQGDYITMQSYPVREGGTMRVEVRRV